MNDGSRVKVWFAERVSGQFEIPLKPPALRLLKSAKSRREMENNIKTALL